LKAHSYPSTDQATPVPVDLLVYLGVPTSAGDALQLAFATEFTVSVNSVSTTNPPPRAALGRNTPVPRSLGKTKPLKKSLRSCQSL
jgi:hypothetical protein